VVNRHDSSDSLKWTPSVETGELRGPLDVAQPAPAAISRICCNKTPITRCTDVARFSTLTDIDQPGVRVITPLGGTNESFDGSHLSHATILKNPNNQAIFEELVAGHADVMITDATETRWQRARRNSCLPPTGGIRKGVLKDEHSAEMAGCKMFAMKDAKTEIRLRRKS
jgi:ABC-type amino acid transport substrate-binding protein